MMPPRRIAVFVPNWIGDAVMATPAMRAVRRLHPAARITAVAKDYLADVLDGNPWCDAIIRWGPPRGHGLAGTVAALWRERCDLAVMLNNSFRSALVAALAGIPRRVGYGRDFRSLLLTEQLRPQLTTAGGWRVVPMPEYTLAIARYLGAVDPDPRPELFLTPAERTAGAALLASIGLPAGTPYVALNPGAAFGSAKMWGGERFAVVADTYARRGRHVVVLCGPAETKVGELIAARLGSDRPTVHHVVGKRTSLGAVKAVIAGADVLITNDSGPRHFGIAFDRPVVSIFGSTDPDWTECNHAREVQLIGRVPCGPCARRVCPLDHACMEQVKPEFVSAAADALEADIAAGRV